MCNIVMYILKSKKDENHFMGFTFSPILFKCEKDLFFSFFLVVLRPFLEDISLTNALFCRLLAF